MGKIISVKIDVKKINKERLFSGTKGTYCDLTIGLKDEVDQYGNNVSIWEQQTKEERDAKVNKNYIGNGKVIYDDHGKPPVSQQQPQQQSLRDAEVNRLVGTVPRQPDLPDEPVDNIPF